MHGMHLCVHFWVGFHVVYSMNENRARVPFAYTVHVSVLTSCGVMPCVANAVRECVCVLHVLCWGSLSSVFFSGVLLHLLLSVCLLETCVINVCSCVFTVSYYSFLLYVCVCVRVVL